jgi:hypothetical protein
VLANHFNVHEYNYKYTNRYGSDKHNKKDLKVTSVTLSKDKKSAEIKLDLTADKVVVVDFSKLRNSNKDNPSVTTVYYTLNQLL